MAQINKPNQYFNTKLYTGTGAENGITGVGFQPDFTWIKERSSATSHRVFDSIRGATKEMFTDLTDAESTDAQSLKSFDSDGFTLGTDGATNGSSDTYASWNWLASNTTASNTDGSITSTVSASTTSGFSIVSWTGTGANATVGHSLNSTPQMIIVKNRGAGEIWVVYNKTIGATKYLSLNSNIASTTSSTIWNDTEPTSSVFSVGTSEQSNRSGYDMIAYCFSEVKSFSKFGQYTGNGSADGTFVYTGFKPAFVIIKRTDGANGWCMFDNKRDPENTVDKTLFAHLSNAESTGIFNSDFLSNGFKIRDTDADWNASGSSYIYMAFAESPLVGTNNIPATAR